MKKIVLMLLPMMFAQPSLAQIMNCKATGRIKNKVIFTAELPVYAFDVLRQSSSHVNWERDGSENRTSITVESVDHFQDAFSMSLKVVRKGKVIEQERLDGLSLKSAVKTYGIYKDFTDTKYKLTFECVKNNIVSPEDNNHPKR